MAKAALDQLRQDWALLLMFIIVLALMLATAYAPAPEEPQRTGPVTCWVEDKPDGTAERICGDAHKAPAAAHSFSDNEPTEDNPAFDCRADGNQICGRTTQYA